MAEIYDKDDFGPVEERARMAEIYDKDDFGPVEEKSMRDDMTTEDIAKHKLIVSEEKKLIKQGYLRIKE